MRSAGADRPGRGGTGNPAGAAPEDRLDAPDTAESSSSQAEHAPVVSRPGRRSLGCWAAPLGIALLLLILFALRVPILVAMGRAVEVHQPPLRADLIFLLAGDARYAGRAQHAASLYLRGFAPVVVMARPEDPPATLRGLYPNDADVNAAILRQAGVPDSAILMIVAPGGATSTIDEGVLLDWYLRRNPAERVLAVTNEYHTRRARWALRRGLGGSNSEIRMVGARDPRFHAGNWWRSEEGLLAYFSEYVKWGHNLLYR